MIRPPARDVALDHRQRALDPGERARVVRSRRLKELARRGPSDEPAADEHLRQHVADAELALERRALPSGRRPGSRAPAPAGPARARATWRPTLRARKARPAASGVGQLPRACGQRRRRSRRNRRDPRPSRRSAALLQLRCGAATTLGRRRRRRLRPDARARSRRTPSNQTSGQPDQRSRDRLERGREVGGVACPGS